MAYALVALDTNRIKSYVFGTDRLREIRGASSILDRLNRQAMEEIAKRLDPGAEVIYANGGSGLFLVAEEKAEEFVRSVQAKYREETRGGASVTGAVQRLPAELTVDDLWTADLREQLDLLSYKLLRAKECPPVAVTLPSHPLLQPCDSCGLEYAEGPETDDNRRGRRCCSVCRQKGEEDSRIKESIEPIIKSHVYSNGAEAPAAKQAGLWKKLITLLPRDYFQQENRFITPKRPRNFDTLRSATSSREGVKDYLGLVYADGNSMGSRIEKLSTLCHIWIFARTIDEAIYSALAYAVKKHLPLASVRGGLDEEEENGEHQADQNNQRQDSYLFPFDVLLLGGDDLMLLTTGDRALDVALEVARVFSQEVPHIFPEKVRELQEKFADQEKVQKLLEKLVAEEKLEATLSVGVVFAPLKYPFGLMHDLVESALRFAKKQAHADKWRGAQGDNDTRINFLVVAGAGTHEFDYLYKTVYTRRSGNLEFRATLRPYRLNELERLLQIIREAKRCSFPRSKLHQLREAVLKMNRTSSVLDALAALHGCRDKDREFLVRQLYEFSRDYLLEGSPSGENTGRFPDFPHVVFPWSRLQDQSQPEHKIYLTPLLDLVELYDFVTAQEGERESKD
ncbi:MAG: hypothetical protein IRZ31_18905 [Thermogemmatispora sp.]|uniref:Cas10/Cmr2 second palm domain-containing protein n=1 Tax=Thermogemmatispora sp. TaxID=1968838 RepID=UPI0026392CC7|nr:hypothetical protein [Thermogemmatispora sp.]MBX5458969.1 hypothetical protein [Thermogemmatispora sp.]